MKSPIQETSEQIVIDKVKIESLSKRFLTAAKTFFQTLVTPAEWSRLGLEKTWRYFLPLAIIVFLCAMQYAAYLLAFATLIITAIWLWKSKK